MGLGPVQQPGGRGSLGRGLRSAGRGGRGGRGAPQGRRRPAFSVVRSIFGGHRLLPPRVLEKLLSLATLSCVFSTSHTSEPTAELDHLRVQCFRRDCQGEMPDRKHGGQALRTWQAPEHQHPQARLTGGTDLCHFVNKIQTKEGCLPSRAQHEPQGAHQWFFMEQNSYPGTFPLLISPRRAPWSRSRSAWKS